MRGDGQDTIIVNRGFVKREYKEAESRPASLVRPSLSLSLLSALRAELTRRDACSQTNEPVALVGMLREQEPRNSFTTVNEPEKGQWTFSDIAEIARFTGAEPVLVDQIYGASRALSLMRRRARAARAEPDLALSLAEDNPGKVELFIREGVPVGRAANIELRNMHLTYAGTWCVSPSPPPSPREPS